MLSDLTHQMMISYPYLANLIFSSAVFRENPRYCYSLGGGVIISMQKLWHFVKSLLLAHLSTKCSWWAIVIVLCPASGVRRPSSTFYLVYALEATVLVGYSWKLVRMFVSMKSRTSSKMGHVGSKTRSLGKILEKPCVRSRGHILNRILMEVGQDVCLDDISDEFENGSRGVKN